MSTSPLWFVLAGFLLGFATSTLWEWFHFRKERMRRADTPTRATQVAARPRELESAREELPPPAGEQVWAGQRYRSPGVFLESEDAPAARAAPIAVPVNDEQDMAFDESPLLEDEPVPPPTVSTVAGARPGGLPARRRQEVLAALRRTSEPVPTKPEAGKAAKAEMRERVAEPVAAVDAGSAWRKDPALTRPSSGHPDNLSKVKGIGDVYRQRLFRAGIFTWRQIAEADVEALRQATGAYPSSNVEEWPVQARALMARHGREQAVYTGPPPDELTKILGIGPVSAQTLYKAGLCTYEQLAVASVPTLAALFPIAVAGDQPDFAAWIVQAGRLADQKHRT